jgi:hypothetical protein
VSEHDFKPVTLEKPSHRGLRPLFVGRIANALDSVVGVSSALFGVTLIVGGVVLLAHNLYLVTNTLVSRSAWLALSSLVLLVLVVALYFWRSSLITRLVLVSVLAVLSFVGSPILERVLN